ncbi:MAG TPA: DNA polymerase I [Myxococcales bacterium]|nr:DNA polymerase I [Myxococcales bacterium]
MASPFAAVPGASADSRPTLILIDGSAYIFRAYHAVPHLSNRQGVPTNAVYGFTNMLLKALREAQPTHVAIALDRDGDTFRHQIDPQYKANRSEPPDDLKPQFGLVRKVIEALNVPLLEVPGVEADDVIGTIAKRAHDKGFRVVVVTGDKDFMQLVGPDVLLFDSMRDKWTGPAEVVEKLGIGPERVIDLMSLCGDDVDNVPGVPGVGPKTAAQLIQRFGTLEQLLARLPEVERPKLRDSLGASVEGIRRARQLVTIRLDVPLDVQPEDLARRPPHTAEVGKLFEELEFTRLTRDLHAVLGQAGPVAVEAPAPEAAAIAWAAPEIPADAPAVEAAVAALRAGGQVALHADVAGEGPVPADLRGLAAAAFSRPGVARAFYFPIGKTVPTPLRALLEAPAVPKVGFGLKRSWTALRRADVRLAGVDFDDELASYLLDSGRQHLLVDVARERLGAVPPALAELPTGKRLSLAGLDAALSAPAACASAEAALRLHEGLDGALVREGLSPLFRELEMPLLPILAEMEWVGVRVDRAVLEALSREVGAQIDSLLRRIHELAGHEFNVASNKQLGQVLFEELKLPVLRRTKTGPSTEQEVLEKLALQHPLPAAVIEHRQLSKLRGTYLDALPPLIDPRDGRLHTTFAQATAATGRLASLDPNLQNIPTRTELGRRIRRAFVAAPGHKLISADYSQIELRVLAHVSEDPALCDGFARNEDVHTRTAAEVFGVAPEAVTPEMRRTAKAINFGIAYGQSAFGLSQRLDLPSAEAQGIIDRYFARYAGVRAWLDRTIAEARRDGAVTTLYGRRRRLPDIRSKNPAVRQAAERMAVNTPIQGTAADLIKRAMLRADAALKAGKLATRMILQVHDELIFEAPEAEVDRAKALACEAMEGAGQLRVPLAVTVGVGASWDEIH